MSTSFAIFFNSKGKLNNLISSSQKYFNVNPTRSSEIYTTLISEDDNCIIKISSIKLKFIFNYEDIERYNNIIENVLDFIKINFINEKISLKFYEGEPTHHFTKLHNIRISTLH